MSDDPPNPWRCDVLSLLWMRVARHGQLDSTARLQPASHSCLQALGDDLRSGGPCSEDDYAAACSSRTLEVEGTWFRSDNLSGRTRFLVLSGHRRFGRGNPSAIEQRSETRGCIGSHLWRHVAVELERGLHAVVAKPLAHSLDVDALLKQ